MLLTNGSFLSGRIRKFRSLPLGTKPPTGLIGVGIWLPVNLFSWAGFSGMPFLVSLKVGKVGFPERGRVVFDWGVGALDFGLMRVSTIPVDTLVSILNASASEDAPVF